MPDPITGNSLRQRIWQGIFSLNMQNSASYAQKLQILRHQQGTAQGFTGISHVIASSNTTYSGLRDRGANPGREKQGIRIFTVEGAFLAVTS